MALSLKKSAPIQPAGPISPPETASYTLDMLESLRKMASHQGHGLLAHLLDLAKVEAKSLSGGND